MSDREIRPGRRSVNAQVTFGSADLSLGDDETVHHVSGEVQIEVSGAGKDYPYPARIARELEAAVCDRLNDLDEVLDDD
jgi:hypothetical protein